MRVKVTSDGRKTTVVNADTGEEVTGVQSVVFRHEAGGMPVVDIAIRARVVELDCVSDSSMRTPCSVRPVKEGELDDERFAALKEAWS